MTRSVSFRVFIAVGFTLGVTALGALVVRLGASRASLDLTAGAAMRTPRTPEREWISVNGLHWQIAEPFGENQEITDAAENNRGQCLAGMVEVRGQMLDEPKNLALFDPRRIEEMQKRTCTRWIQKEYPERCAEFDREAWLKMSRDLPRVPMNFCMDRFEYPNRKGAHPLIFVRHPEAEALCQKENKRLCTEDEWTFACEGEEATPYPYGYVRSAETCAIDGKWRAFNERGMQPPRDGYEVKLEMDRLWQGVPSGSRPACKSAFGIYDMTGNVDEWTVGTREGERKTILKGGYWGPVRTRCRPSTRSHDENHVFYQQGFRCCANVDPNAKAGPTLEAPTPSDLDPSTKTSSPSAKP